MKKGLLIIFAGLSGVGKGTILKDVMSNEELKLAYSVSMTTRAPRPGEVNGVNYFFVTKEEFEKAVEEDKLLEHAEFVGNCYGTPKDYVEKKREEGYNVLLEIETNGAKQIISKYGSDVVSIYVLPPSIEELENRLIGRGTESKEVIAKRIEKARLEMKEVDMFNYIVVNDDLDKAKKEVEDIIRKEMNK